MQRRLILGPAEPHAGADQQRKQTDARQHEIQPVRARRDARQLHGEELGSALAGRDVFEPRAGGRGVERIDDVVGRSNGFLSMLEEHIARLDAGAAGGRVRSATHAGNDIDAVAAPRARRPPSPSSPLMGYQERREHDAAPTTTASWAVPARGAVYSRAVGTGASAQRSPVLCKAKDVPCLATTDRR